MEKSVFFPLKTPKHLEKFQKVGVGHAKSRHIAQNAGHATQNDGHTTHNVVCNTLNVCQGQKGGPKGPPIPILKKSFVSRNNF